MASSSSSSKNADTVPEEFNLQYIKMDNVCTAAYVEVMQKVNCLKEWGFKMPPIGSLDRLLPMFQTPESPETRVECFIESGHIDAKPDAVVDMMMSVNRWNGCMCPIVQVAKGTELELGAELDDYHYFDATFLFPTPYVAPRKFQFMRFKKVVSPGIMAVIDVDGVFLAHEVKPLSIPKPEKGKPPPEYPKCRRRPSGLLIKEDLKGSQFMWVENVEVLKHLSSGPMFSQGRKPNWPFTAKRWADVMKWHFNRQESSFDKLNLPPDLNIDIKDLSKYLLVVGNLMKKQVLLFVCKAPIADIEILEHGETYISMRSFCVKKTPSTVFEILKKENLKLQGLEVLDERCRFRDFGDTNCISVTAVQNEQNQPCQFVLQDASADGLCFFVTSLPISLHEFEGAVIPSPELDDAGRSGLPKSFRASGFAIAPSAFDVKYSQVTIVLRQAISPEESNQKQKLKQIITVMSTRILELAKKATS